MVQKKPRTSYHTQDPHKCQNPQHTFDDTATMRLISQPAHGLEN